jgi:hypothetical protein
MLVVCLRCALGHSPDDRASARVPLSPRPTTRAGPALAREVAGGASPGLLPAAAAASIRARVPLWAMPHVWSMDAACKPLPRDARPRTRNHAKTPAFARG